MLDTTTREQPRCQANAAGTASAAYGLPRAIATPLVACASLAAMGNSARLHSRLRTLEVQLRGRASSASPPATARRSSLLHKLAKPLRYCTTWWRLRPWLAQMRATNLLLEMMKEDMQRAPVMHDIWLPQAMQSVLACGRAIAPLIEVAPAQLEQSAIIDHMERATLGIHAIAQSRQCSHLD